jgi:coenzyme F420-0:L-glutamate ligase/coenzyme F420-1:gamma-L-glutamate ligase
MSEASQPPAARRRASPLSVSPIEGLPLFAPGMSVAGEIARAAQRQELALGAGDVVVVAQKIVSKAEGRTARLRDVAAGPEAQALGEKTARPAALAQLMLDESEEIVRATHAVVITRHRTGHVLANAGIDASNVQGGADDQVLLWPKDPDASARAIRAWGRSEPRSGPAGLSSSTTGGARPTCSAAPCRRPWWRWPTAWRRRRCW